MDLKTSQQQARHYVNKKGDSVAESFRGNIEEIDFDALDLLKVPTLITAAGMKLVHNGSKDLSKIDNVKKVRNGRILDIVDGLIAREFDLESDAGALADVSADKLEQLVLAIAAWKQEALPKSLIAYLATKNIAHTLLTVVASMNHPGESFRTPKANKYAMFLENLGAGLLLEANAYEREQPETGKHTTRRRLGKAALAISIGFEVSAIFTMVKRLNKDQPIE